MKIIPGSHRLTLGDLQLKIKVRLEQLVERGELDLGTAISLDLKPGQFYLFHSWILHASEQNDSEIRRAALNIRFVAPGDECEPDFFYLPVRW